ncbi:ribonucleoside-diphosphate reductase, adenosylcobalamin-dependent [Candidatus Roizmanbacteria bacterium RIFCSPHIGHO2_12_FULL_42_10]|uniref:Vitamin B12-dependent ribonucleotide reductase n=1 Tax=Candidatus Roizmanbacteria bacterium RIFCSPHIGHO2_12_FULL_42_10 TaxID=1802053 RepID=A0A1F7I2U3_9BACT|nr:MAG: ribonucleoside-diphosphate reductase, adenosylcobalamin-dependent [Candidatus Roizmanbacteria bacterium RIFCSPHIGHO2_12_FULL_42_10]
MKLTGIAHKVFMDRYALKNVAGDPVEKAPEEMWQRVARGIAQQEKTSSEKKLWEKKFYDVLKDFKFVPGGRILSGAGTDFNVTYYNCFVIPDPKDSRGGILESLNQLVEIQARSGGVGLNLSSLRPRGARVKTVNGFSSGPVTWAGLFSYATHDVVQQGGSRRGATMLMLWDWHPDVEEFITVKQDLTKINGANLSVCLSDAFMEAVKQDKDWDLIFPDLDDPEYNEKWDGNINAWRASGHNVKAYKTVKARDLWNQICTAAWRSAEPGLHFLERSNRRSNTWYFETLCATNPCGEQPLGPWAVCNLGAMNLSAYVTRGQFDYERFGSDVKVAMRFLDNVIDDTYYFFKENEQCAKDIRRTGLGIMGLADALIKMKMAYGSDESLPVIRKMFKTLRNNAYEASIEIAK